MDSPWSPGRRLAPLRAPRAHDELRRRARATTPSPGTTARRLRRRSRSPTTGTAATPPRRPGSSCCRASSSTACSRSDRDGHVLGFGIDRDPTELEGERRDLAETAEWIVGAGGVAYLAHPYWTGATAGRARAARHRRRDRGLQRGLRARGRARTLVRALGRAPRGRAAVPGARDRRQPSPRLRLRPRVDLDPRRADGGGRARGPPDGPLLRQLRPGDPRRRRSTGERGRRALQPLPARSRSSRGRDERHGRERGHGSATATRGRARDDSGRAGSSPRGSTCPRRRRSPASRSPTPGAAGPGRTRCGPHDGLPGEQRAAARDALEQTPFDLLVIGGGVIGAATAAHAARAGLAVALVDAGDFGSGTSSASSKLIHGGLRYLRLGDVRLVREAHHERRALAGSSRRTSSTGSPSCSRCTAAARSVRGSSRAGSSSTRRSRCRGSTGS